jgi:thiamine-phosphate pyrophosphorylase
VRLIVITHPDPVAEELVKINALFDAGMEILHIRKPKSSKEEYMELLNGIHPKYHAQIKIHEFFELTDSYALLGVHLNARNTSYSGKTKVNISKSCHTIEELEQIAGYDYVFLSPIFDSISKAGYVAKFSNEMLQKASAEGIINEKVIALGGIDEKTLPLLTKYPWGGAAALGSIWNGEDVVTNYLKLKAR